MGMVSFDKIFQVHQGKSPIILNDQPAFSDADRLRINKLIYTNFKGDILSNIPSCECGEIFGEYNIGLKCEVCHTHVQHFLNQDLMPLIWIRAPKGVENLMNPMFWMMLKNMFSISSFNLIHWLCQDSYTSNFNPPAVLKDVEKIMIDGKPIERGYSYFVKHFDQIIEALLELPHFQNRNKKSNNPKKKPTNSKKEIGVFRQLVRQYRHCLFSKYLPIPHRSLLVVEENDLGIWKESLTTGAIDAILTLTGIDVPYIERTARMKENRTVKTIDQLALYYESVYKESFASKEGVYRKHVYAGRVNFSFRAVITSITDKHDYRHIYLPWGVAMGVLRLHLVNKLINRDYTPNEALVLLDAHAQKYHPLIDELFEELIRESPSGRGICALINRNPSLARASIQRVYISKIKKDPSIPTVSVSILIVRGLNADFDGKALPSRNAITLH